MYSIKNNIAACVGSTLSYRDLNETTNVWKIETSECPNGYVHLILSGRLHFNWETDQIEYFVEPTEPVSYLTTNFKSDTKLEVLQGPAQVDKFEYIHYMFPKIPTFDSVPSVRLLGWPPVAQSWISRNKNYGWPSSAVVSEVQRNGCDLVPVAHRDYKHDSLQWRYSFSRAEVTLIRSWNPIQQIIYNMLKYVVKLAIIREWKDDDKVICTYHLKTLMLWACERKSPVWWESNCVLELCSKPAGHIDEVDQKETLSSLFHTRVEFVGLHHEGIQIP